MYFVIELMGWGRRTFVESYSNTAGAPRTTFVQGQAKPFDSEAEAHGWAKLTRNHRLIPVVPFQATLTPGGLP
jgi:hypothetical protein